MHGSIAFICLFLASCGSAFAQPPAVARFSYTQDVGFGTSVFVVGSADLLGAWTPTGAVKLRWSSGNVWTGQVAIPSGATTDYKYIWRSTATDRICDPANVTWMSGGDLAATGAPAMTPPQSGKTIYYLTGWTNASLLYRVGTNWLGAPMERIGDGRTPGEYLYRATGIGTAGQWLEFVPNGSFGGVQYWDNAPYPNPLGANNYFSPMDVLFLQDGQLFDYTPPASLSAPSTVTAFVFSEVSGIPNRTIRIHLPRGYTENTWKSYPVLYMHDGQNVFTSSYVAGFSSTVSWNADGTAQREISQGRMREMIIVGIDNYNRHYEYVPNGDIYKPGDPAGSGHAGDYLSFVIRNVKPTLDYNYRTLSDWRNTAVMGSSLGGICSIYFGYETNVFGIVGAMSPSFGRATNYANAFPDRARNPLRVYIDTGTAEGLVGDPPGVSYWEPIIAGYAGLLKQGYAHGHDLLWNHGCGHEHNETAWAARLPHAFRFLFPPSDEPNRLQQTAYPPAWRSFQATGAGVALQQDAAPRYRQVVEAAPVPAGPWQPLATNPSSTWWTYPAVTAATTEATALWRIRAEAD